MVTKGKGNVSKGTKGSKDTKRTKSTEHAAEESNTELLHVPAKFETR